MYVDNREAVVPQMNYVVVFNIDGLENYSHKI